MNPNPSLSRPDKSRVARSFGAAAASYDGVAGLQREVAGRLLEFGGLPCAGVRRILDVGAGTGYPAFLMRQCHPEAELLLLDLAEGMLYQARRRFSGDSNCRFLRADAEALPLAGGSVDLVFSNLALQWCVDLDGTFAGFRQASRPGGFLLFATFGPTTLAELRAAWEAVDEDTHVNEFSGPAEICARLQQAGYIEISVQTETRRIAYPTVLDLMRELKGLGAHNATVGRPRHLTGKEKWRRMIAAYEARMEGEGIRAGFEVVYGRAVCGPSG